MSISSMTCRETLSGTFTVPGITSLCAFVSTFDRFGSAVLNSVSSDSDEFSRLVDDTDRGDVWWLNQSQAQSQQLAYINEKNQVVMKVDNSSYVPLNQKRNSVRIESVDWYGVGTLWIVDIAHVPFGCSVSLHARPISWFSSVTDWDRFRFGPHSGPMVSRYESRVMRETPSLMCSPACPQCRCSNRQEMAGRWRDRHLG